MPEFEFQNGFVFIDDDELVITAKPIIGLKQWYRERKSTLLILILATILEFILAVYDLGPARQFTVVILIAIAIMMLYWFLIYFNILEGQPTTIPKDSIKEVKYHSINFAGWSKITILYEVNNGDEVDTHERDIQTSFPFLGGNNRLEPAITTLQNAGIKIQEGQDPP